MRIILSPAKKMRTDTDNFPVRALPACLPQTKQILAALQALSPKELQTLWKCNDAIAGQNVARLADMDLEQGLTPAVMAYEGIAYRYLAPGVLDRDSLAYLDDHLRILSGFYGLLRPFDGVTPYRLEMGAKLSLAGCRDLYEFWGDTLARILAAETDLVVDLASAEYSRAVLPHLPKTVRVLTCTFGEEREGKVVEKGTLCKMARGQMTRWLAEGNITTPQDIQAFHQLGYRFSPHHSTETRWTFLKEPTTPAVP